MTCDNLKSDQSYLKYQEISDILKVLEAKKVGHKICLFLDIDGTLSHFDPDPEKSFISQDILDTIRSIQNNGVPIFIVTGRSINKAYALLNNMEIPIAGTHGLEIYAHLQKKIKSYTPPMEFFTLKKELKILCAPYPDLLIEYKTYSVALHYRNHPQLGEIAHQIMQGLAEHYPFMKLSAGKYVWELVPYQADKGLAIHTFITYYQLNDFLPIFIGDDLTDESGFKKINQYDGLSIKVGDGETHANYKVPDVDRVAKFLMQLQQHIEVSKPLNYLRPEHGEQICRN